MRKFIFAILSVAIATSFANAGLLITEVVDGDRVAADGSAGSSANSDPFLAFVEISNTDASTVNLGNYHFTNFNNGSSDNSFSSTPLSGSLASGQTFYLAYESDPSPALSAFERVYGFAPNVFMGGKFTNGDDAYVLLDTAYPGGNAALDAATVVDQYGIVGTDGSGEAWEYTDAFASRDSAITSATANPFTITEWTISNLNATDGLDAAAYQAATSVSTIPEPSALGLLLVSLVGLVWVRRQ